MNVSRMGSTLVAIFALAAVASSCGEEPANAGKDAPAIPKGPVEGSLTISQWPLYIDPGKNGTVREFEAATGVSVEYIEEINDNVEFFGKLRPMLERGDSGNRSLITVSDWLAAPAERGEELDPCIAPPRGRPEARVHGALAERHDGADRPQGPGARRR